MTSIKAIYADEQSDEKRLPNLDVFAEAADGELIPLCGDMTPAGLEWWKGEMALVDDSDKDQIAAVAAGLRSACPRKYRHSVTQAEYERLANLPLRRCNGQFKSQEAW